MSQNAYDVIIVGAGPAGYVAAIRAAQLGMNVACIEKGPTLGGTCLNVGCIPSKALLDSSEHFLYAKSKLSKHGVMIEGLKLDLAAMMKRKDSVVRQLTQGIDGLFKKNKITRLVGHGSLKGKKGDLYQVDVKSSTGDTQTIESTRVLLATGSEPASLPSLPFDGKKIISSTEALSLTTVPKHLVVVGAGVIGLEMGSVWSRLGSKVTVVEFQNTFLPTCDTTAAQELWKALQKQGFEFRMGAKVKSAKIKEDFVLLEAETDQASGGLLTLECDVVLVAIGRRPYSAGLGLESVGIATDKQGRVTIDDHFQTVAPGIYAIGDLVRGPMLAHKSEEEGVAVAEILAGQAGHVNYDAIPNVIYTWPELASVGATEQELKAKGVAIKTGVFPFMANGRAKAMDETDGSVKVIADAVTDRVLGVHITGPRASDMIAEAVAVMEFGGSAEDIARTCHAHPTLAETLKEAALAVDGRRIHL